MMKKNGLFFSFFISVIAAFGQSGTFAKVYNTSNGLTGGVFSPSMVYGNRLYNSMHGNGSSGMTYLQKNDLNGNVILTKAFNFPGYITRIKCSGGFIYLTGWTPTSSFNLSDKPFLAKIDTGSCSLVYFKVYTMGLANHTANTMEILNDGNVILGGWYFIGNNNVSFITGLDGSTGNPIFTHTLTAGTTTLTYIDDVTQISNSTILFTGQTGANQSFIGKILKNGNTFSIVSLQNISKPFHRIWRTSNPKTILLAGQKDLFKTDTSLTSLNSATGIGFLDYSSAIYFNNDHIYRFDNYTKMEIIDTAMAMVSASDYTQTINSFTFAPDVGMSYRGCVSFDNSSLYINTAASLNGKLLLIKTTLMGDMNCSQRYTPSVESSSLTAMPSSFITGNQANAVTSSTPSQQNITISPAPECIGSSISEKDEATFIRILYDGDTHVIKSRFTIEEIQISDVTGKLVHQVIPGHPDFKITVDIHHIPKGMYIARVFSNDGNQYKLKLINP